MTRAPTKDFAYLQSKLEARLVGWRSKCLSWAGIRTLITSMTQTIPIYARSTFNIPNKVCNNLDSLTRRFWWTPKNQEGNFLAWRSWDKFCFPKKQGGLGFRKFKEVNNALLAKQAWMIASKIDSLCMSILRAKYKISKNWLYADSSKRASPIWKAIEQAKNVVVKGACYIIEDGTTINVWQDPWVPWIQGFIPSPRDATATQSPLLVCQLFDPVLLCWKTDLVKVLFDTPSAQAILSILVPPKTSPSKLIWVPDSKGCFLVKSAYLTGCDTNSLTPPSGINWNKLWQLKILETTKMFFWRLGVNALPTRENLRYPPQIDDSNCVFYKEEVETPCHLFLGCLASKSLWFAAC